MDADRDLSWDEAHRAIVPLMRADNRTNAGYILREYGFLIAVFASAWACHAEWTGGRLATSAFVALATGLIVLVAVGQHRLSGLAHDASHGVLFRDPVANELASDLLLLFPLVAMTQTYRSAHLGHHRFVNDPARDPDLIRLAQSVDHDFPVSKPGFWRRYVLVALWPPTLLRYLFGRAKAANLGDANAPDVRPVYRMRVARCLRGAYWLSAFTIIHASGAWPIFFLFWVAPLLSAYPLLMLLREIAHHSNAPDDGDLTNSRVFVVHPLLSAAIFPYGQAFHLTHHLFARVPHHRVAEAHRLLLRHRPYRERVVICRGYFFRTLGTNGPSVLDVLSSRRPSRLYKGPTRRRSTPSRRGRSVA